MNVYRAIHIYILYISNISTAGGTPDFDGQLMGFKRDTAAGEGGGWQRNSGGDNGSGDGDGGDGVMVVVVVAIVVMVVVEVIIIIKPPSLSAEG